MKIILGSNNISKKNSIILALNELNIIDCEIICVGIDSNVSSKPINEETLTAIRQMIGTKHFPQSKFQEIADLFGISEEAAKKRGQRIIRKLRLLLEGEHKDE